MQIFEKPLHEFTDDELRQKVNQLDPRFGALVLHELQRRQQKENTEQIAKLIKETKVLKNITDKNAQIAEQNARNSNVLAKVAVIVAVVGILAQVAFSVDRKETAVL